MEHWYLVHTKPSRERHAAVQLHQRGFVVYFPLIWVSPVKPRARREQPFFPRHLFAKLDLDVVGPDVIRWLPGVRGLVEFYGEPASMSDAFVADLREHLTRARAVGGLGLDGARYSASIQEDKGPFEGYEGMLNSRLPGADRARILLACVQQEFWRQTSQARLAAGRPDDPAAPRPSP
jgi:transcriptional antiterminator RfaH